MEHDFPVLIVGGGPAGLVTALLLAQSGVPSLLVERHTSTSIHPRARGLNLRTMEIFRSLGLEKQIQQAGASLADNHLMLFVETLAGREIRRVPDADLLPVGKELEAITPCTWCQCAQDELEPILLAAAREKGAHIQFHTELQMLTYHAHGIEATVLDTTTGQQRTIHTRYLIAADGAHSQVRQQLGLAMQGRAGLGNFINIYFRADLRDLVCDRPFGICFVENEALEGVLLPVNNTDRWLLNVEYAPERGAQATDCSPARCQELVRAAIGRPELELEVLSVLLWEAAARVAEQMQVGNIFLVGDAAHTMPPAGGFGMNTAIQDAHNLAWKLAMVIEGEAGAGLLDTYAAERYPLACAVVKQATRELEAETPDTPGTPGDLLTSILGYSYASSAIMEQRHDESARCIAGLAAAGRPGTRASHVWLTYRDQRISTLDLFGRHFVLLPGALGGAWRGAAHTVAERMRLKLAVYQVGIDFTFPGGDESWHASCGITAQGALLVRPDGFVCWRSSDLAPKPEQLLTELFQHILSRGPCV
ncbi:FAD-dependent monooxygenase [Dictyobacter aurantiacus]|uniref:FAD-binding monooxygenase n=1 Tax=Dictyobacter aurantiacus TaxID=1936993 RepID=A0A401ZLN5_9CHLR|nr:FAD-dependent monooxygenase [Dictyobacter aurantiacus]GCE07734.1 FAD-binding monooxygenase [Dictyobacter aurantiacus]